MFDRKEYMKGWRKKHKEYQKQWQKNNREKTREYSKQYYKNNREKVLKKDNQYRIKHIEKKRKYNKQYQKYRRKTDLKYNLNHKIGIEIRQSLKGNKNGRRWEKLVGYTLKDLIKRLKSAMPKEYTWQDYLDGRLQMDHIIPINAFNFSRPEHIDFKRCWSLKNLRLLPKKENLLKYNKLKKSFQPALKI